MLNALWFRPDGGRERYLSQYGEASRPITAAAGAEVLFPFVPVDAALEGGFDADLFGLMRYPSADAFDDMWSSDQYAAVAPLRANALDRAVLTRCAIEPADAAAFDLRSGVVVMNALWFVPGGRARYDEYLAEVAPIVEELGGALLSPRLVPVVAVEGDFVPDLVFFGYYPSKEAHVALRTHPGFPDAASVRASALERSVTSTLLVP